jgi:uncharacterized protein
VTTADDLLARAVIAVLVKPGAAQTAILGVRAERVHIALKAPPIEGKANEELLRFLSKHTGRSCTLMNGSTSKKKLVRCI